MKPFKENTEMAIKRIEAWWNGEMIDRVPIIVTAPADHAAAYEGPDTDDLKKWWTEWEFVLPRNLHALENTYFGGEAFPTFRPIQEGLVSIVSRYVGAKNTFVDKHTTWAEPFIEDWRNRPELAFNPENFYWQKTEELISRAVDYIEKNNLDCFCNVPDFNGPTQTVCDVRGMEQFAFDLVECPQEVVKAFDEVNKTWLECWKRATSIASRTGGYLWWMNVLSKKPATDLQSDVSCILSPQMFDEYLLPFIRQQSEWVDRSIYHLDGPDAVRHLDSLLSLPGLDAIQWVSGAGQPPANQWPDLLKRIRKGGKQILISSPAEGIQGLLEAVGPEGLLIQTFCRSRQQADDLLRNTEKWSVHKNRVRVS